MKFIRSLSCWLIGGFFIFAGIAHFVSPAVYLPMMPPYLPWPMALIYLSGAAEIAGEGFHALRYGILVQRVEDQDFGLTTRK
jgi:uncharacterized membrane protein